MYGAISAAEGGSSHNGTPKAPSQFGEASALAVVETQPPTGESGLQQVDSKATHVDVRSAAGESRGLSQSSGPLLNRWLTNCRPRPCRVCLTHVPDAASSADASVAAGRSRRTTSKWAEQNTSRW